MPTVLIRHIHTLSSQNAHGDEWHDAAVRVRDGWIEWVGPDADLPPHLHSADEQIDGRGLLVVQPESSSSAMATWVETATILGGSPEHTG